MLLIRRLWLLPALIIVLLFYYLFWGSSDTAVNLKYPSNGDDGKLHWTKRPQKYPVKQYINPPRGSTPPIARIQFTFEVEQETFQAKKKREERRDAVKQSFVHAWEGYKKHAWTKDEVAPLSGGWRTSFGGWGATLVDSMDTLWIMGLKEDFEKCVQAVAEVDFTTNEEEIINVFETTIRYMGGMLAAYDLAEKKPKMLLKKARQLADILLTAFDTPNRMPMTRWTWRKSAIGGDVKAGETTLIAELGSMIVEFTRLSQLTGDLKYFDAVERINDELRRVQHNSSLPGMWPVIVNAETMDVQYNHFTLSGMADSAYEYLPKQWILMASRVDDYRRMYEKAYDVAKKHLFFRPMTERGQDILLSGNAFTKDEGPPELDPQGQHLACFAGGMVGLAGKVFRRPEDLDVARRLVDGCLWAYNAFPSGLMPETFHTVPCHIGIGTPDAGACVWSREKWLTAVADRQGTDPTLEKMSTTERGEYWVKQKNLAPGFTDIGDPRYILRYVQK